MKAFKLALVPAAAAAVLAVAGVAWSGAGGDGPRQDRVYGGGTFGPGCSNGTTPFCPGLSRAFSISANGSPTGQGVYGRLRYGIPENGRLLTHGRVTAMRVDGNSAVVCGIIEEAANPEFVGGAFHVVYQDNGPAGSLARDGATPVFVTPVGDPLPAGWPRACFTYDELGFDTGYFEIRGDVVIEDE